MALDANVLIVGYGNMGQALVAGMVESGLAPQRISVVEPAEVLREKALKQGFDAHELPATVKTRPDVVLLAVKPQIMAKVAPDYARFAKENCFFISIAAGVARATLHQLLGNSALVARAMPNTPAAIGYGMSVLCDAGNLNAQQHTLATDLLACVGEVAWVDDEELMDAVTAVSGSGPAYFFLLVEALAKAGTAQGLPYALAEKLAVQTAYGAGTLLHKNQGTNSPADLRRAVTSPGGTTAAALDAFDTGGFRDLVHKAVEAATARGRALRKS